MEKTTELAVELVGIAVILGLTMVFLLIVSHEPKVDYNHRSQQVQTTIEHCLNQGGEYSLSVKPNGEVDYEWCEIIKKIDYN